MLKNVDDGSLEVVLRGPGALLSNLDVAVIDAAVINGAKSFRTSALGNKNCRFRRDFGVGESDELVMPVEENMFFGTIDGFMLTHSVGSFSNVGIDEPKHYRLRGEFAFEVLHFGNVAIRDGTVGCDKKENNRFRTGSDETGNGLAIQVVAVGRRCSLCERDERDDQHTSQSPYFEK
jgi:hypothetical protein